MQAIVCPNCTTKLKAKDETVGKRVACPKCQTRFTAQTPPSADDQFPDVAAAADGMEFLGPGTRSRRSRTASTKPSRKTSTGRVSRSQRGVKRRQGTVIGLTAAGICVAGIVALSIWLFAGDRDDPPKPADHANGAAVVVAGQSKTQDVPSQNPAVKPTEKSQTKTDRPETASKSSAMPEKRNKAAKKSNPVVAVKKRQPRKARTLGVAKRASRQFPFSLPQRINEPEQTVAAPIDKPLVIEAARLSDGLAMFSDNFGLQIAVPNRLLDELGLTFDSKVSLNMAQGTVADGLSAMLRPLDLHWTVRDGVVVVSDSRPDGPLVARAYRVTFGKPKALRDKILRFDFKENWSWLEEDGQGGSISIMRNNTIVVVNKLTVLLKIEQHFKSSLQRILTTESGYEFAVAGTKLPAGLLQNNVSFEAGPSGLVLLLAKLGAQTGLKLTVNTRALAANGIAPDVQAACRLRDLQPVQILNHILEPLSLTWILRKDGRIEVTTRVAAAQALLTATHQVDIPAKHELLNAVNNVGLDNWDHSGGNATADISGPRTLRIKQTVQGHAMISRMLAHFRRARTLGAVAANQAWVSGSALPLEIVGATEIPLQRFTLITTTRQLAGGSVGLTPVLKLFPAISSIGQFSPSGDLLALQVGAGALHVIDDAVWKSGGLPKSRPMKLPGHQVLDAVFSHNGKTLVTAGTQIAGRGGPVIPGSVPVTPGRVDFWDVATGKQTGKPITFKNRVCRVVLSPDGTQLAVSSSNPYALPTRQSKGRFPVTDAVWIYDAKTRQRIGKPIKHIGAIEILRFSANGKLLVSAGPTDTEVKLWNTATGSPHRKPLKHPAAISDAVISSNARYLAVGCYDGNVYLWDTTSSQLIKTLRSGNPATPRRDGQNPGTMLAISRDGKRLASAQHLSPAVRIWDMETGKAVGKPLNCREAVVAVEFSPDGSMLLVGNSLATGEGYCQLWSTVGKATIGPPMKHQGRLHDAKYSHDGQWILTRGGGVARMWTAPVGRKRNLGR